jgi:two-component system response regulator PilR (NtrC family)
MSTRVLIIDDEESIRDFLSLLFAEEGYAVTTTDSVGGARQELERSSFDLILCDILMPDGSGLDLLQEIVADDPRAAVIMMTAYTSTKSAIEAMKLGAYDYISKPFDVEELKVVAQRALEKTELVDENLYLRKSLDERFTFDNIVGRSPKMQAIFSLIQRMAKTTSTVLIYGESGTGKELIARAIHHQSDRAKRRFLSINCGALPENLLESELFGHERGAFTGAVKEKQGMFQEATGGTLFLDEIGEMTLGMQVKLLRALQEKTVRKVGGNREESVDVRIVAATNQDLQSRLKAGSFREDLFYRINVIPIHLPPLRHRREDIPLLVDFFLDKLSRQLGIESPQISLGAMEILERYDWPGNVRELENLLERALALSGDPVITADDLPQGLQSGGEGSIDAIQLPSEGVDLEALLESIRSQLMRQALEFTDGNQTRAAEMLGMTFRSFRYYAKKQGLTGDPDNESGDPPE